MKIKVTFECEITIAGKMYAKTISGDSAEEIANKLVEIHKEWDWRGTHGDWTIDGIPVDYPPFFGRSGWKFEGGARNDVAGFFEKYVEVDHLIHPGVMQAYEELKNEKEPEAILLCWLFERALESIKSAEAVAEYNSVTLEEFKKLMSKKGEGDA